MDFEKGTYLNDVENIIVKVLNKSTNITFTETSTLSVHEEQVMKSFLEKRKKRVYGTYPYTKEEYKLAKRYNVPWWTPAGPNIETVGLFLYDGRI